MEKKAQKIIKLRQSTDIGIEEDKETLIDLELPDDIKDGEALFVILSNIPQGSDFDLVLYDKDEQVLNKSHREGTKRDYIVQENVKPSDKFFIGVGGKEGSGTATITAMCLDILALK